MDKHRRRVTLGLLSTPLVATLAEPLDARTQNESHEELEHEVREAQAEALDQVASESDDSDI